MAGTPFYYPDLNSLQTSSGPLIIGSGLTVDYESGILLATPGGLPSGVTAIVAGTGIFVSGNTGVVSITNTGVTEIRAGDNISVSNTAGIYTITAITPPPLSGGVTCVGTGTGLTGGPIVTTGAICLAPSGVTEGCYLNANITVDSYGRVTSASTGKIGQNIVACPPITVTGTDPVIVDITSATTAQRGVVALCNACNSTSQLYAATPLAVSLVCQIANNARICAEAAKTTANDAITTAQAAQATSNTALTQSGDALTQVVAAQGTADTALADALNAQNTANCAEALATSAEILADTALTTAASAVPLDCYTQTGTVLVGLSAGLVSGVTPTADNQILISCSLCAEGAHWFDPGGFVGTVTQINTGGGIGGGPITTTGTICINDTGVTPNTYSNPTITVNSKGQITSAVDGSVSAGIPCGVITRCGDMIVGSGPAQPTALPPGNRGQILTANPDCALMMEWAYPAGVCEWTYYGPASCCICSETDSITWYTITRDELCYRQLGPTEWEVLYNLSVRRPSGSNTQTGLCSYIWYLPQPLCFANIPSQTRYKPTEFFSIKSTYLAIPSCGTVTQLCCTNQADGCWSPWIGALAYSCNSFRVLATTQDGTQCNNNPTWIGGWSGNLFLKPNYRYYAVEEEGACTQYRVQFTFQSC